MNTNRQIIVDQKILRWVAMLLNILVKLAGKIAPKDHNLSRPFHKIGICKFKGLGSIVHTTPLIQTLRKNFPEAQIVFVSTAANEALLKEIKLIDEAVILHDSSIKKLIAGFLPFVLKLYRRKFDVYIDLEVYSNFGSIVSALTNAQNRFGYYQKESSYKMGIYTHMMYYNNAAPISQAYLQWARLLGCKVIVTSLYQFHAPVLSIEIEDGSYSLKDNKYFVINPNASDLRIERRWSAASFSLLIENLLHRYPDYDVLLIGSKAERSYVSTLHISSLRVKNIAGLTDMAELIAVIQNAALVVTNDTGPMHLAFAMKKKTVALFGPCAPAQYGAHESAYIIYKNVYCSPCVHEFRIPPCQGNNQCMKQITQDEVLTAVAHLISGNRFVQPPPEPRRYESNDPDYDVLGMVRRKTL